MHPKDPQQRPVENIYSLVVEANQQVAYEVRIGFATLLAKWRRRSKRDQERTQLANMSEREWSDLGLSKCDVVREIEKPGRIP